MKQTTLTIQAEAFSAVGKILTEKTALSPFSDTAPEITDALKQELQSAGITGADGSIDSKAQPLFSILSGAKRYTRISIPISPEQVFEYTIYYDAKGNSVSMQNSDDGLLLSSPAAPDEILNAISQVTGSTALKGFDFKLEINDEDVVFIAALADIFRKEYFRTIGTGQPFNNLGANAVTILEIMNNDNTPLFWFSTLLKARAVQIPKAGDMMKKIITRLTEKKLIKRKMDNYALDGEGILLAQNMLMLENIVSVVTAWENESGKPVRAGFNCLQTGIHNCLYADSSGSGQTLLESISPAVMLQYINAALNPPANK